MFLTELAELAGEAFFLAGQVEVEVVKVCEVVVDEFWRAGEESAVNKLRNGILYRLRESIEAGEVSGQLVGVWRRIWILDPNTNDEKGRDFLQISLLAYAKNHWPFPQRSVKSCTGDYRER